MTFSSPNLHFIDTAPLFSRYDVLVQAMLAMTIAGQFVLAGRAASKIGRLVRVARRLEAHNVHLQNKLDMLCHKPWREKVLKDLGGLRKLKLWDACKARIEARAAAPRKEPKPKGPAWLYTPERIAESERLKARKRACLKAGQNPRIVRDRYKVDVEGDFRLAPLPREAAKDPWQLAMTPARVSALKLKDVQILRRGLEARLICATWR